MPEYTSLSIQLETMPDSSIWTGDADMQMSYIKATSLIGGVRFWTEALLRSCGATVCTETRCIYDPKKSKICDACRIFGCTGVSRAFSLKAVQEKEITPIQKTSPERTIRLTNLSYTNKFGKRVAPTYYFPKGYEGKIDLQLAVQHPVKDFGLEREVLSLPPFMLRALALMIEYGTIGAGDQYGCGLVKIAGSDAEKTSQKKALMDACGVLPQIFNRSKEGLSFQDFFFFKGTLPPKTSELEIQSLIRYKIRNAARPFGDAFRHWFCGSLVADQQGLRFAGDRGKNNSGSKFVLGVSQGMLYGWGHFSKALPYALQAYAKQRDPILDKVKAILMETLTKVSWKEFDSHRDTCNSPKSWKPFLTDMLASKWR